ncbi:MAG: polynucleotide adenylyltransferase PcnB [Aquabacterium sp.]|nr:MAG: polynucleotide adenylyltransferase PcnB [Aquabacterium sp.]
MIKKFISNLLDKAREATAKPRKAAPAPRFGKRVDVPAAEHGIDPSLLDERAIKVVETLQDAGYEAYIVGGAVRDLLVGRRPKDFDVATNATPEQVKGLFRRAFIIGRRFRIVHVVYGRGREHEVIEVSTFRAYLDASQADQVEGNEKTSKNELAGKSHVVDASGRVLRDNVWGPQDEDATRRDFTVNAMYYDPRTQTVVDYHHGIRDVKKRVLRMIGDPLTRFREDPVRVLRVVRFAAKLGFDIEPKTRAQMPEAIPLLENVPASRMFDEMIKLLQTGHALASIEELRKQGLIHGVFPIIEAAFGGAPGANPQREKFIRLALADTDRRVNEDKSVAPSFMLSCLLWHDVLDIWERNQTSGAAPIPALQHAIDAAFDARIGDISGRGKLAADMREIWMMQPRFDRRTGNGPYTLAEQPRFRAGFDFLRLRAEAGEAPEELARWWEGFSLADAEGRRDLLSQVRSSQGPKRVVAKRPPAGEGTAAPKPPREPREPREPRPPRPVRAASAPAAEPVEESADIDLQLPLMDESELPVPEEGAGPAAKKRRRRRRKPAGAGGASGGEGAGAAE